jgi:DNA-binding transcriptional regulator PaaX
MKPALNHWLLLTYKIPREPTAHRVSVWRKLKQLGALLLNDAVWILPATPQTREQFQWLAAEIVELGGQSMTFVSQITAEKQNTELVRTFSAKADDSYKQILTQLRRKNADLAALSRRYQQTAAQDYFHSILGDKVRKALLAKGEAKS